MTDSKKGKKFLVLAVGAFLIAAAVLADKIGIGGWVGFGWRQAVSLIVGIGLVIWGIKSNCCLPKKT